MYKYKKIKLKDGRFIDEHRLIMEKELGRKLGRNEVVHHKNENGKDNIRENLELKGLSKHSREHRIGSVMSEETKNKLRIVNQGSKGTLAKLTEDKVVEIKILIKSGVPCNEIGKIYKVDGSAIRQIRNGKTWTHVN